MMTTGTAFPRAALWLLGNPPRQEWTPGRSPSSSAIPERTARNPGGQASPSQEAIDGAISNTRQANQMTST